MLTSWLRLSCVLALVLAGEGPASPVFDVILPRGINFTLQNSPTPQKYLIETMPGGVALLDYNNDGLLDIFFVNGGHVSSPMQTPENFDRHDPKYWNRLYRQNKDGSFTDVTEQAGLARVADGNYGMGVAVGDYEAVSVLSTGAPPVAPIRICPLVGAGVETTLAGLEK